MKVIGLDVGTKRIGVAKVDSKIKVAVPDGTITVNGKEFTEIARLARLYNTKWFVIGMPRNSAGEKTAQSDYVEEFARKLKKTIPGVKIGFQDESLTSVEAEARLKNRKSGYNKGEIDAEAAAIILQDFIENFTDKTDELDASDFIKDDLGTHKTPTKSGGKKIKKKLSIILLTLILLVGIGGFLAYGWYNNALTSVIPAIDCPEDNKEDKCLPIDFVVEEGENPESIGNNLAKAGLIRNSLAFRIFIRTHHQADSLKTGQYSLKKTMSVQAIIDQLIAGGSNPDVFRLTILPGETIKDIKKKLIKQGYSTKEVDAAFAKDYDNPVLADKPATPEGMEPLEGYIFGDTYEFYNSETVENIIQTTLAALQEVVESNDLVAKYQARGLSLYQGITLASIVQKETKHAKDQPTVAQVFLSRLNNGMMLGSDVTVKYVLDNIDPDRTTYQDNAAALKVDSPYNTRLYAGLPPGPISNPGASALLAVANPSETSYLFFLTGDDGMMYYSNTDAEHQKNASDHCSELCKVSL